MLCPEVWAHPPPAASHNFKSGKFSVDGGNNIVKDHYFNNLVSVVIPNFKSAPEDVIRILKDDAEYYFVKDIYVYEFVSEEFIESFVKKGYVTVLSDKTWIDVDDCLCITPNGELVLNILKETYVELGVEGHPSSFSSKNPSRYSVSVDLCNPSFIPGKKNYERIRERLKETLLKFDILVTWEPPDDNICPSSIAAYFHKKGYTVALCETSMQLRSAQNIAVPLFPEDFPGDEEAASLLEWLGILCLNADLKYKTDDNFVSTYLSPAPNMKCKEVLVLVCEGLFSVQRISLLLKYLSELVKKEEVKPWLSLHVQGFADSPLSWGKKEHTFFTDGDNHYTIFLNSEKYLTCKIWSSCRGPNRSCKKKKR